MSMMPVIFSSPAPSKERSHWKALTQALHINFLAGKRHFLLLRYCLHCHDQAAVSLNSWQESSKVLSAVQTHRPGVHPSRLYHGHVAPAEKAPKVSHLLSTITRFNPAGQPAAPCQQAAEPTHNRNQLSLMPQSTGLKIKCPVWGSTIIQREDRQSRIISHLICFAKTKIKGNCKSLKLGEGGKSRETILCWLFLAGSVGRGTMTPCCTKG